jgi:hypothetical protein
MPLYNEYCEYVSIYQTESFIEYFKKEEISKPKGKKYKIMESNILDEV